MNKFIKKITPNSDPRCFRGIKMEPICRCNEIAHVNVVKLGLFLILSILACLGCPHRQNGYMTYMGGVLTMYDGGLHGSLFLNYPEVHSHEIRNFT